MEYKLRTILNIEKKSTLKGFRMVFPLLPSVAIFGCIFGFTGGMFKYSLLLISLSSVIVFAGTSQFIVLTLINQNEPFIAIALSGIIVNLRHILYGAALRNDISTKGVKRFILAYLLTDEAFLVTKLVKKNPLYDKDLLLDDVLFGSGILVWIIWNISTVIGYLSISVFEFNPYIVLTYYTWKNI